MTKRYISVVGFLFVSCISMVFNDTDEEYGVLSPESQQKIEQLTKKKITEGNEYELLIDPEESFQKRLMLIKKAQHHINVQVLFFENNETSKTILNELKKKAEQGVFVNIIVDGISQIGTDVTLSFTELTSQNNFHVLLYTPKNIADQNFRIHEKFFLIDGKEAIFGGRNIGDSYFITWRDTDVYAQGPIVSRMEEEFMKNLSRFHEVAGLEFPYTQQEINEHFIFQQPKKGKHQSHLLCSRPIEKDTKVHDLYAFAITSALEKIIIETPYFVPTKEILDAIMTQRKSHKEVIIITNSLESIDTQETFFASAYYFPQLYQAGVKIFLKKGHAMHSKVMLVDDNWTTLGSYNVDYRSSFLNSECIITINGKAFAQKIDQMLNNDMKPEFADQVDEAFLATMKEKYAVKISSIHLIESQF